jgi:hypothetical protein
MLRWRQVLLRMVAEILSEGVSCLLILGSQQWLGRLHWAAWQHLKTPREQEGQCCTQLMWL